MQRKKSFWFYPAAVVCLYFLLCGFAPPRLPQNTFIDGADVSGMAAPRRFPAVRERLAEELADKVFTIRAGGRAYSFRYPEIYYETNAREVVRAARKGGSYVLKKSLRLTKIDDTLRGICDDFYKKSEDAHIEFLPCEAEPFRFSGERAGQYLNGARLKEEVETALEGGVWEVCVQPQKELPRLTERAVRAQASLLSAFTTYFSAENAPRAHNIALAAEKLNGTVLEAGEILSFNKRVGPRTAKNGFLEAPIIKAGEYVPGLGGGVCQASTTLYNAALLAGLEIKEYHPAQPRFGLHRTLLRRDGQRRKLRSENQKHPRGQSVSRLPLGERLAQSERIRAGICRHLRARERGVKPHRPARGGGARRGGRFRPPRRKGGNRQRRVSHPPRSGQAGRANPHPQGQVRARAGHPRAPAGIRRRANRRAGRRGGRRKYGRGGSKQRNCGRFRRRGGEPGWPSPFRMGAFVFISERVRAGVTCARAHNISKIYLSTNLCLINP